jgi:hypothetical protein
VIKEGREMGENSLPHLPQPKDTVKSKVIPLLSLQEKKK